MLIPALLGVTLLAATSMNQSNDKLAAAIQPFVDRHSLAGAVMLVANRERVLDVACVGLADIAGGKAMKPDDLFWIASESKPITATAFMMLVDEGKVHLDDPVSKYLPEFGQLWVEDHLQVIDPRFNPNESVIGEGPREHMVLTRPSHPITVREILSHTSGMRFSSLIENPTLDLMPLRDAVGSYALTPLETDPETKYSYSNAGVNTAGRIIEVVSGMPYEKFLEERLFKPLGMKDTTFLPNKHQIERLAKSYKPDEAKTNLLETPITQLKYPLDDPHRYPFPAGGLFSTSADMCRFGRFILNGGVYEGRRLVSEQSIHEMTTKQTGPHVDTQYGLGWGVGETFGHGGAYSTDLTIDPKHGLVLIWMVQQAGFANDGDQAVGVFKRLATELYGNRG